jgi:molybdopterin-guanine dinucleotide biosynthesis protein A
MPTAAPIAGLLLTGGRSTRYGRDKGPLFGPRVADVLRQVADPVHEVGPGWTSLPAVADPGEGPLRALACAPACGDALVLACDLPLVSAPLLRWLADQPGTAVPVVEGRAQPLCARYSQRTLARAGAVVGRAMRDLLDVADDVTYLDTSDWDPALFADVDSPA